MLVLLVLSEVVLVVVALGPGWLCDVAPVLAVAVLVVVVVAVLTVIVIVVDVVIVTLLVVVVLVHTGAVPSMPPSS